MDGGKHTAEMFDLAEFGGLEIAESSDDDDDANGRPAGVRAGKIFHAAARRMAGLRVVLDASITDRGTRAAILRSTESFGLLHAYEIETEALLRKWESSASEKWLIRHTHSDLNAALRELQAEGISQILAVVREHDSTPSSLDTCEPMPCSGTSLADADFGPGTALIFCECMTDCMREALCNPAYGKIAVLRLGLADEVLPLSVLAAITLHYGRTARARAQSTLLNKWGGDLDEIAVHELHAEYLQRGRGFRRGRRIQGSMRTDATCAAKAPI